MSNDIGRGTTPFNRFRVPIDLRDAKVVWLTYKQGSKIVLHKVKEDLEISEDAVVLYLTQKDTLAFKTSFPVRMQIRARLANDKAVKSRIIEAEVSDVLKDGVI